MCSSLNDGSYTYNYNNKLQDNTTSSTLTSIVTPPIVTVTNSSENDKSKISETSNGFKRGRKFGSRVVTPSRTPTPTTAQTSINCNNKNYYSFGDNLLANSKNQIEKHLSKSYFDTLPPEIEISLVNASETLAETSIFEADYTFNTNSCSEIDKLNSTIDPNFYLKKSQFFDNTNNSNSSDNKE